MSPERHGRVWEYGFGPIPTLAFGSTSRRQLVGALATQLENAQELLAAAKQKLINAIGELSHVKETFEERLIKVQKKTREEVKEEFEGKISRTDDPNDATISTKAIEFWRLCYIFIW